MENRFYTKNGTRRKLYNGRYTIWKNESGTWTIADRITGAEVGYKATKRDAMHFVATM